MSRSGLKASGRLLEGGPGEAAWNMAVDEALLRLYNRVQVPTLRLYSWCHPTLSLGRFQRVQEVNLGELARRGYALVRRPTGGRAVLHDQELTYSFVGPCDLWGRSVLQARAALHEALAQGLARLGLPVQLAQASPRRSLKHPVCFACPSHAELLVGGRKVVGSAQTRAARAILEHGSIPLWLDYEALVRLLRASGTADDLRRSCAGLQEFLPQLSLEQLKNAVRAGFEERFRIVFEPGALTAEERALAEQLAAKYASKTWTLKR